MTLRTYSQSGYPHIQCAIEYFLASGQRLHHARHYWPFLNQSDQLCRLKKIKPEEEEVLAAAASEEEESESESEYETDSDEEQMGRQMLKPVFVTKKERETIAEREALEREEQEAMQKEKAGPCVSSMIRPLNLRLFKPASRLLQRFASNISQGSPGCQALQNVTNPAASIKRLPPVPWIAALTHLTLNSPSKACDILREAQGCCSCRLG